MQSQFILYLLLLFLFVMFKINSKQSRRKNRQNVVNHKNVEFNFLKNVSPPNSTSSMKSNNKQATVPICDNKKGIFNVLVFENTLEFIETCMSVDRNIYLDDGTRVENVCTDGFLRSDYISKDGHFIEDCRCDTDSTRGFFEKLNPNVPRCVKDKVKNFYIDFVKF